MFYLFETQIFTTALFWFFLAMVFAAIEIEVEGKHGWAEKTSTWFRTEGMIAKAYGFFMGGKPLTGYHLFMFFLPLLVFHAHFVMGVHWSLVRELLVLALYFAWMPVWDYLWFALNPYYGVKKFKKEHVWWHARSHWLFKFTPLDYVFGWIISVLLAAIASRLAENKDILWQHLDLLVWFFIFTTLTILFIAPLYRKWHWHMRQHDDRNKSGIFHTEKE